MMDWLLYPLAFAGLLGVLVVVHEFGHFIVARKSGVHVLSFSVGFGRALLSWVDKRGTTFKLSLIPLGGYVRMFDERDDETNMGDLAPVPADAVSHSQLSAAWKIAIAVAGPLANFILAAVIYALLFMVGSTEYAPTTQTPKENTVLAESGVDAPARILRVDGRDVTGWQNVLMSLSDRLGESGTIELDLYNLRSGQEQTVQLPIATWLQSQSQPDVLGALGLQPVLMSVVGEVVADSPASRAGLQPGDWVVGVNGRDIELWREWVEEIVQYPNTPMLLTVVRRGQSLQLSATPGSRNDAQGKAIGFLGVSPDLVEVRFEPLQAMWMGWTETFDKTAMTLSMLKKMLVGLLSVQNLVGPVGIAQIAGDTAKTSWQMFFGVMALMSISLGVLNLLPVPLLDGGQIVLVSIEAIKGSPVSDRLQQGAVQLGLLLVGIMFVLVTFNDLTRLFG
jgi:regulator of sigma E protease